MEHLLKIKCVASRVNVHILASTSVPFTLTTVQVPNLALTHMKRIWEGSRFFVVLSGSPPPSPSSPLPPTTQREEVLRERVGSWWLFCLCVHRGRGIGAKIRRQLLKSLKAWAFSSLLRLCTYMLYVYAVTKKLEIFRKFGRERMMLVLKKKDFLSYEEKLYFLAAVEEDFWFRYDLAIIPSKFPPFFNKTAEIPIWHVFWWSTRTSIFIWPILLTNTKIIQKFCSVLKEKFF